VIVELAMIAIAVKLALDDFGHGVRYRQSDRLASRGRGRTTGQGPIRSAARGYVADLAEDATASARAWQARQSARRAARRAGDGRFTDFDPGQRRWIPRCDVCGWTGRAYRVEAHADAARHQHACPTPGRPEPSPAPQDGHRPDRPRRAEPPRRPESAPEEPEVVEQQPTPTVRVGVAEKKGTPMEAQETAVAALQSGVNWADSLLAETETQAENLTAAGETMTTAAAAFRVAADRYLAHDLTAAAGAQVIDAAEAIDAVAAAYAAAVEQLRAAVPHITTAIDEFHMAIAMIGSNAEGIDASVAEGGEAIQSATGGI
jgi:hypothetical protein